MNKKIKAILFDMDGVLIDSEPLHFEAHKKALKHFGVELSKKDYMDFGVAKGDRNLYEKAAEKFGIKIDKKEISKLKKQIYVDILNKKGKLIPGVLEFMESLCGKYELAIVSSGARDINEYVINKFKIRDYFKIVVTGDDVERVKPFPDIYLKAINMLGCAKDECVAIEDSESGLVAAKDAGIKCVVVPCEFTKKQNFSRADILLEKVSDLSPDDL